MILCCGEALIDMIPTATEGGKTGFVPHAGGSVFNTAIALGRLRTPTGFISGLSTDFFGEQLRVALVGSNVDCSQIIQSDQPTTLGFVHLVGGHATYSFYDENTAGRMLDPEMLPEIQDTISAMYFGGISLISEPCADFYVALAKRESKTRVIMADPNIRPSFIKNEERYRARLEELIHHVDILKVSDEDLNWIIPEQMALVEKVDRIRAMGPKIVLLTRGGAGASALTHTGEMINISSQIVEVVDTVGAGDTFNAGVLANLFENGLLSKEKLSEIDDDKMIEALTFGARVAAITVSRSGANPPWAHELG